MVYLTNVVETYRADSESEAKELIEKAKRESYTELVKYSSTRKEVKMKGEIVDEYFRVSLTKRVADEKEPLEQISVKYSRTGAFEEDED